jgi:hypothetical protein
MELVITFKTDSKILSCHQPLQKNNETTCSHFNNQKPSVNIFNNLKEIVTVSSACLVQTAIRSTTAKNWMSGKNIFSEHWSVRCISTSYETFAQEWLLLHLRNMEVNFLWQKLCPNAKTKWKTKYWLHIFELLITFLTTTLSWKKWKQKMQIFDISPSTFILISTL